MASNEKTRYKAIIADHTYTIIGQESKQHMDLVTKIVNEQLAEIKHLSPQTDTEQASVLLEINAISDQQKKQEYALNHVEAQQILNENRKQQIQNKGVSE